ncbi:hypothetical protein [Haliangium ochraceum]|uniref:Uncharacterized protein n=1 Tax=Haliangium ochraceum (strain DSM 14365 / JCM 11303 / SMP-2) TaxID=502025 RepID=D0LUY8_HALO1|nr:hypothetical protein [Haliangium ochraceum]ACY15829.1 hypothetical protein Hoch_3327 [Haliangium ochraceum DSM 14365]
MDLEQLEAFALSEDRERVLAQLVPGTEEYYYLHCLHHQHRGELAKSFALLERWIESLGRSSRARSVSHRQAVLSWQHDAEGSAAYLRQVLGLRFDHARELAAEQRARPTSLDPARITRAALTRRALAEQHELTGFADSALRWLDAAQLDPARRRVLLSRLHRPARADLVELVLADLEHAHSGGFGSLRIHELLTREQLDTLGERRPALRNAEAFVTAYLRRLVPHADAAQTDELLREPARRRAHLLGLWQVVASFGDAFASLKAHVLYHLLAVERALGSYDRALFLRYLRLPRRAGYMRPEYLHAHRHSLVDLDASFATALPAVGNDEPLVRDYLAHFLRGAEDTDAFSDYIREEVLRVILAEVNLLAGIGDAARWHGLLDNPGYYRELERRVLIDFTPTQRERFARDEPVALELDIKNVTHLLIKIYEIDTLSYFSREQREIDTDVDLDGLPASYEQNFRYEQPPLRLHRERFELSEITRPGVYVVDFIGNGTSSRALIRKGHLGFVERAGAAGQVLTIIDEAGHALADASVWMGDEEFAPRADGTVLVPYSTRPGRRTILLGHGELTVRSELHHLAEDYQLELGFYVDREALVPGNTATLLVRAQLTVHGEAVRLALLEDVSLTLSVSDRQGVSSERRFDDFALPEDGEATCAFAVPAQLAELQVTVRGRVRSLSTGQRIALDGRSSWQVNELDSLTSGAGFHLSRTQAGYAVHLLGKNGEGWAAQPVVVSLHHRDFVHPVDVDLQSDEDGAIALGPLSEITQVAVTCAPDAAAATPRDSDTQPPRATWRLGGERVWHPSLVHLRAGEDAALPYVDPYAADASAGADESEAAALSLFELCPGGYRRERSDACHVDGGYVHIVGLTAGDYALWLEASQEEILIRVAAADADAAAGAEGAADERDAAETGNGEAGAGASPRGWIRDRARMLRRTPRTGLHITAIELEERELVVHLDGVTAASRVHVFGARFVSRSSPLALAPPPRARVHTAPRPSTRSHYVSGRRLGDEYRYVLERKHDDIYPGVMLERPSLLLNPWALRATSVDEESAREGDRFGGQGTPPRRSAPRPAKPARPSLARDGLDVNLDFVAEPASVWLDLRPQSGADAGRGHRAVLRIPRAALGHAQLVRILALDGVSYAYREQPLPPQPSGFRDLRLAPGLDPERSYVQAHRTLVLPTGETWTREAGALARWESYDTLDKAYALLLALSDDDALRRFGFLLEWPTLSAEDKRARYSEHACHELHLFLARKDPAFFAEVVQPYLRCKLEKTFLDHYLLGDELGGYRELWAYGKLNTLERVLLAERIPDEGEPTRRQIRDHLAQQPRDPEREERQFRTALHRGGLEEPAPDTIGGSGLGGRGSGGGGAPGGPPPAPVMAMAAPAAAPAPAPASARMQKKRAAAPRRSSLGQADGEFDGAQTMKAEAFEEALAEVHDADALDDDVRARDEVRRLYRAADQTQEWAESQYHELRRSHQRPGLIPVNAFWRDFAERGEGPFLSAHLAQASSCFAEMVCALAVLDLPFAHDLVTGDDVQSSEIEPTPAAATAVAGGGGEARGPAIVFCEELRQVEAESGDGDEAQAHGAAATIQQRYLRPDERYTYEAGEARTRYVSGPLLQRVVYGCEVVIGNHASVPADVSLLYQIPSGAMPVASGAFTRSQRLRLRPYETRTFEYCFYFPASGSYEHYPAHLYRGERVLARAGAQVLEVVADLGAPDTSSWAYLSQHGSGEQVLAYLERHALGPLDLGRIAWRMEDRGFYDAVLALLSARHVYERQLWSYALRHRDGDRVSEILRHEESFLRDCGLGFSSPLIAVDARARAWHEHLEYAPLIHARSHRLGAERRILNAALAEQYTQFLELLAGQAALSPDDRLAASYYLLLQGRVSEGLEQFERTADEASELRVQRDYLAAVVALYRGDATGARARAEAHAEHPVDRWRRRFGAVLEIVAEALGDSQGRAAAAGADSEGEGEGAWLAETGRLADSEPSFDLSIEGGQVVLDYQHLREAAVRYYLMDIELSFSRSPFVAQATERFALVKPHGTAAIALPADGHRHSFALPAAYARRNVVVEVIAGGLRRASGHYAHELSVHLAQSYGQVRVRAQGGDQPLPRSYVKVYARMRDGSVRFYKDGYTDLRGCFDYASLSTDALDRVERFSMLVATEEHGALIREVAPPPR